MAQTTHLSQFVRESLVNGMPPQEIEAALMQGDWTQSEIKAALSGWFRMESGVVVPRAQRGQSAKEALFYAVLFLFFGMIVGHAIPLIFGLIDMFLPEPDESLGRWRLNSARWSMAALVVSLPVFALLNARDNRQSANDPARQHGRARRWLSALAIFVAATVLLADAICVVFWFLKGEASLRFLLKAGAVAVLAAITFAYFRETRKAGKRAGFEPASWALLTVATITLALSFWSVGGPAQGLIEQRDAKRLNDLRLLANDLGNCAALEQASPAQPFDPMDCAQSKGRLSGYASELTFHFTGAGKGQLCADLEAPDRAGAPYNVNVNDSAACRAIVF